MDNNKRQISLPHGTETKVLTVNQNIIIIGANGAGKTRLGAWIESQAREAHRISAQKSLSMPDASSPTSLEKAEKHFLYGREDVNEHNAIHLRNNGRWGNKPATFLLSDFERLMVLLFSEDYEISTNYRQASKDSAVKVPPPETKLDTVKRIWEDILPHRELVIGGGTVRTKLKNAPSFENREPYNASEMSDGERVIFYLVGECLAAPTDGIVIIDEPEIHVHKSIQVKLWNEIEKSRPDCLFIYITHDSDFAASKESSVKLWLKSYDGTNWEWEVIQQVEGLPEQLLLEVLGSRKPLIFVEGEKNSYDVALYRAVLPSFLVIPVGGCSQVIQSVKALRSHPQLHHLDVYGIIDRDRRVDTELSALEANGIFALEIAEVENLFCTPEILALVAQKLELNPTEVIQKIENHVFTSLQNELEVQISLRTESEVKFQLMKVFDEKAKSLTDLQTLLTAVPVTIDAAKIYADSKSEFDNAINNKNYKAVLRLYNRKSLASQVGKYMSFSKDGLPDYVVRLAKGSSAKDIADLLKPYFGAFADKIA